MSDRRPRWRSILVPCLCLMLMPAALARAGVPGVISYQGLLTDETGVVLPDATYSLTFRIYDAPTGGAELFSETHAGVATSQGVFSVLLGSVSGFGTLAFDAPYWLGIQVDAGPELTPRVALASTPYALNAASVQDDAVTGAKVADGSLTVSDVVDEPSVAYFESMNPAGISITSGTPVTIASAFISIPRDGYILVRGAGTWSVLHLAGQSAGLEAQLSETSSWTGLGRCELVISQGSAGGYAQSFECAYLYQKPAGSYTFNMLAAKMAFTSENFTVVYPTLEVLYIPRSTGTITWSAPAREGHSAITELLEGASR